MLFPPVLGRPVRLLGHSDPKSLFLSSSGKAFAGEADYAPANPGLVVFG